MVVSANGSGERCGSDMPRVAWSRIVMISRVESFDYLALALSSNEAPARASWQQIARGHFGRSVVSGWQVFSRRVVLCLPPVRQISPVGLGRCRTFRYPALSIPDPRYGAAVQPTSPSFGVPQNVLNLDISRQKLAADGTRSG